jgi:hypothetical protein
MQFDFALLVASLHDPRRVARWLISQQFGLMTAAMALALTVVLTVALSYISYQIFPADLPQEWVALMQNPVKLALLQGIVLVVMAMLATGVGRWFRGQGRFEDAVLLLAWVQLLMLALQFVQMFFLLIFPAFAQALGVFGIVLSLWMLCNFLAEMHGFQSALFVFGGMLITLVALSFAGALVVALTSGTGV